jgi:ECF sigma factor
VPSEGSITILIGGMRIRDDEATRRIWQRFSPRVAALACKRLPIWLQRFVDGDDLANSAIFWKFEGYTNDEIAQLLGCSLSKVARKLELIRKIWAREEL